MTHRLSAANNAVSTLSSGIGTGDTSLTVADGSIFPAPPFLITIDDEIMEVGGKSVNNFTSIIRAQEGTSAATHNSGAYVTNAFTKGTYDSAVPLTTQGDILYAAASGINTRLPAGTATHVLKTGGPAANPSWAQVAHSELSGVSSDQHHAQNHALISSTGHTASGLTTGHFLKATGATTYAFGAHGLTYSSVGAAATIHNFVDTTNHPVTGLTSGHFLKATGTTTYAFGAHGLTASDVSAIATTLMTTRGDIIFRNATVPARLAAGTSGDLLQTGGTAGDPSWTTPTDAATNSTIVKRDSSARFKAAAPSVATDVAILSTVTDAAQACRIRSYLGV